MFFFFELHRILCPAHCTKLREFHVLPCLTLTILPMQANSTDPVIADGTEHGENGALTSWHGLIVGTP